MRSGLASCLLYAGSMSMSSLIACAQKHAMSQYAEDLVLLPTLLNATRGKQGTFVELGALDGRRFSNTLMLEQCFGFGCFQANQQRVTHAHKDVVIGRPERDEKHGLAPPVGPQHQLLGC